MKSKSTLALMEQIIMLCVFAVAAAICIQAFAWSDKKSEYNETRSLAAISVQSVADTLKSCSGSLEDTANALKKEYTLEDGKLSVQFDGYNVTVELTEGSEKLGSAEIEAKDSSGEKLVGVSVSWQKGAAK